MRRRDLYKVALAASAVPGVRAGQAKVESRVVRLKLRHTWTTVMSSSDFRDTLHVKYTRGGITGHGEGAPIPRYKETALTGQKAVESVRDLLTSADARMFAKLESQLFGRIEGEWA